MYLCNFFGHLLACETPRRTFHTGTVIFYDLYVVLIDLILHVTIFSFLRQTQKGLYNVY